MIPDTDADKDLELAVLAHRLGGTVDLGQEVTVDPVAGPRPLTQGLSHLPRQYALKVLSYLLKVIPDEELVSEQSGGPESILEHQLQAVDQALLSTQQVCQVPSLFFWFVKMLD